MHDFRLAFRLLCRTPGFTIAAVVTLAIGIGATTAIFTLVDAVLLRPLDVPAADRVVALTQLKSYGLAEAFRYTEFLNWKSSGGSAATFTLEATNAVMRLARLVDRMLFGIQPHDVPALAGALTLLLAALIGSAVPLRRAARVDPVVALRAE